VFELSEHLEKLVGYALKSGLAEDGEAVRGGAPALAAVPRGVAPVGESSCTGVRAAHEQ
jgi:hypothetical protein